MQKPKILWPNVVFFSLTFIVAFIAVPYRAYTHGFDDTEILFALVCFAYCSMSITAGYHRLWSHRTYQAKRPLCFIYALGGAFAMQNSALHWSSDHRVHHKHVDNNNIDPYSANKGFWYSHIGWMLREYQAHRYNNYENVRDLKKDPIVMWQHKHYWLLTLLMNIGVPLLFGWRHGDIISSLLLVGVLRLVLNHHTTFFINSLAHIWGKQTYSDKNSSRDNGFIALLTFGEGYHNFHHNFENDYRNGIKWWQFDPTKWLIKGCEYLKLTSKLKTSPEDLIEKARLRMMLKKSQQKIQRHPNADKLYEQIQKEYDILIYKVNNYYEVRKILLTAERDKLMTNVENSDLMAQYLELKKSLQLQRKHWAALINGIY